MFPGITGAALCNVRQSIKKPFKNLATYKKSLKTKNLKTFISKRKSSFTILDNV